MLGTTPAAIHTALAVANAVTTVFVFVLARRLGGALEGVAAALAFAVLSLSPEVLGLAAYAEPFLLVFALAGLLLLREALPGRRTGLLAAAGLLLGAGLLVKQSGVAFVALALAWTAVVHAGRVPRDWGAAVADGAAVTAGALAPLAVVCGALALAGSLGNFWFWAFEYASLYVSAVPLALGPDLLLVRAGDVARSAPLLIGAGLAGAVALVADPRLRPRRAFVGLFMLFSFLAVAPGLYFRHQYVMLFLPAVAIAAGVAPAAAARLLARWPPIARAVAAVLLIVPAVHTVWNERFVLLQATPLQASRRIYGWNPFPESLVIADYIKNHTSRDDRIAVIGSEPQIYFYAERPAATSYIYMYPLMERHPYAARMQSEMIRQIEAARPTFLVYVRVYTSWLATPESEQALSRWLPEYGRQFERVGVVDMTEPIRYVWGDEARTYSPRSELWLGLWRRRPDGR
jgi:hypothetical protein